MPRRTVYFAKVTRGAQVTMADRASFRDAILEALDPQHKVERYGRTWRFSRPIDQVEFILGKLGFTHEGEQEQTDYDEDAKDFVTALAPARQTFFSHFVIDTAAEVVAFEDRGRLIRRQSFMGAFDGLLEAAGLNVAVDALTDRRRSASGRSQSSASCGSAPPSRTPIPAGSTTPEPSAS